MMAPRGSKDQLEAMKQMYSGNSNTDLIASNSVSASKSVVFLLGRDIITEFFNKEFKLSKKVPFTNSVDFGFIDFGGEDALKKRALFKQFFHQDNLADVLPRLHKIIEKHAIKLEKDNWPEGSDRNEFKVINFSEVMDELFADIVDFILLGNEKGNTIDGKRISTSITEAMDNIQQSRASALNALSCDKLNQWKVLPAAKKAHATYSNLEDKVYEIYLEREKDTTTKRSKNVIDLIIEENRKLPEGQKWSKKEIVSNINLFQIAGADTTVNGTSTFVYYLAGQPSLQEKIRAIVSQYQNEKGDIDLKELSDSEGYSSFIKEVLRMFGPAMFTTIRKVIKTAKLGKYTIRRGDVIFAPCALKHNDPQLFEKPLAFALDRFKKDNVSKINRADYAPFGRGNRNCVGQYLAEMMLCGIFGEIMKRFELSEDPNSERRMKLSVVYGIVKCSIKMRPFNKTAA